MTLPGRGPNSPFSVGPRTLLARTCRTCGKLADGESYPILNRGRKNEARRKTCHDCTNANKRRDRLERGIGVPTPRPPEELQTSKYRRWTKEDDDYLREQINEQTYDQLAVHLGRSLLAVYNRRTFLGLAKVRPSNRVAAPWRIER